MLKICLYWLHKLHCFNIALQILRELTAGVKTCSVMGELSHKIASLALVYHFDIRIILYFVKLQTFFFSFSTVILGKYEIAYYT